MEILIYTIGVLLTYIVVLHPYWQAQIARRERDFEEIYHAYKLRMVRRHYPDLRHLSFSDLEELYDIDGSFNNIGHFRPQSRLVMAERHFSSNSRG